MKRLLVIAIIGLFAFQANAQTGYVCVDSSIICPVCPCSFIFLPVCACDGNDYSNECVAQNVSGSTEWFDPFVSCADIAADCLAPARHPSTDFTATQVVLTWDPPIANAAIAYRLQGRPAGTASWANGPVISAPTANATLPLSALGGSGSVWEWRVQSSCAPLGVNIAPESEIATFTVPGARLGMEGSGLAIFPNPAQDQLNLTYITMEDASFSYEITDMMGRLHKQGQIDLSAGIQSFQIDVSSLGNGFFTIVMQNGETKLVERFLHEK